MFNFLKLVAERLRMDLLLASLAFSILLFKLVGFDVWWMIFSFCIFYLVLLSVDRMIKRIKSDRSLKKKSMMRAVEKRQEDDYFREQVWKRFYVLEGNSLELVKRIFRSEKDPDNALIRYVRDNGSMAYQIEGSPDFRIPEGDRWYRPLLHAELIANASVITFDPYYLALVEHYVTTGKKERV